MVCRRPRVSNSVTPANYDQVADAAMRILSSAVIEVAALRVWKKL
jgi:hypothetical protein